jgi:hypothetical protein
MINPAGINIGDNTQNQDQSINPVSFKVMKIRVSIGRKGSVYFV